MSNLQSCFDGRRAGKAPERSNFVQTCNLLNQFLKGKVNIRDLSSGVSGGKSDGSRIPETSTMDLLTIMEKPSIETKEQEQKSVDPVPPTAAAGSSKDMEVAVNEANTSKEVPKEPKAAQLTMFYDGKVIVFDDFPADKARAVMLLASKGCPQSSFGTFQTTTVDKFIVPSSVASASLTCNKTDPLKPSTMPIAPQQQHQQQKSQVSFACNKTDQPKPGSISAVPQQQQQQIDQFKRPVTVSAAPQKQTDGTNNSDLPIARRSSLHRFLEKRKDRAGARAPYQLHNNNNPLPSSSNNGASSSKDCEDQLDLNFKL